MGKVTFIVGGARSGKSTYATTLAQGCKAGKVAFIATGQGLDKEMASRIKRHIAIRPKDWRTFEEPRRLSRLLKRVGKGYQLIIVDCLTLFTSNLLLAKESEAAIIRETKILLSTLKQIEADSIIVSNEVGLGIVPQNKLARDFRDTAGKVNQLVAVAADVVYFMFSGIPGRIK